MTPENETRSHGPFHQHPFRGSVPVLATTRHRHNCPPRAIADAHRRILDSLAQLRKRRVPVVGN